MKPKKKLPGMKTYSVNIEVYASTFVKVLVPETATLAEIEEAGYNNADYQCANNLEVSDLGDVLEVLDEYGNIVEPPGGRHRPEEVLRKKVTALETKLEHIKGRLLDIAELFSHVGVCSCNPKPRASKGETHDEGCGQLPAGDVETFLQDALAEFEKGES